MLNDIYNSVKSNTQGYEQNMYSNTIDSWLLTFYLAIFLYLLTNSDSLLVGSVEFSTYTVLFTCNELSSFLTFTRCVCVCVFASCASLDSKNNPGKRCPQWQPYLSPSLRGQAFNSMSLKKNRLFQIKELPFYY